MRASTKFSFIVFPLFILLSWFPYSALRKWLAIFLGIITLSGFLYYAYKEKKLLLIYGNIAKQSFPCNRIL